MAGHTVSSLRLQKAGEEVFDLCLGQCQRFAGRGLWDVAGQRRRGLRLLLCRWRAPPLSEDSEGATWQFLGRRYGFRRLVTVPQGMKLVRNANAPGT